MPSFPTSSPPPGHRYCKDCEGSGKRWTRVAFYLRLKDCSSCEGSGLVKLPPPPEPPLPPPPPPRKPLEVRHIIDTPDPPPPCNWKYVGYCRWESDCYKDYLIGPCEPTRFKFCPECGKPMGTVEGLKK